MSIDFSCQDKTPQLCAEARAQVAQAHITIIGVGALGTTAASMLVRSGAEQLVLVDDDRIEESNLPRQTLFDEQDTGKAKTAVAAGKLRAVNAKAQIAAREQRLSTENIDELLTGSDLVLDCTDNQETRRLIDTWCAEHDTPWVHAAATGAYGEAMLILPGNTSYKTVMDKKQARASCAEEGIMTVTASLTATVQATLALKLLCGQGKEEAGKLYRIDAWRLQISTYTVSENKA